MKQNITHRRLVTRKPTSIVVALCITLAFVAIILWPHIDLIVSGWFYKTGKGFFLAEHPVFLLLHWLATVGARILGVFLIIALLVTGFRKKPLGTIGAKGWLFLFLGLLLAPGLIGNVLLKDQWGRIRPRDVVEFGGKDSFSPALVPQKLATKNGSFVSGDAAFGFYLPSFGYVVSQRQSRRFFWGGMGIGVFFGLARIAMGAHFFSDTLFAALFMLVAMAALYTLMFGRDAARRRWQEWLFL